MEPLTLGSVFPNEPLITTDGNFQLHDWIGENSWAIFFSHPADFTPVCTTELKRAATLAPQFLALNTKLIALSCDTLTNHLEWIRDIESYGERTYGTVQKFPFPIIADEDRRLATRWRLLDPTEVDQNNQPLSARSVFFIGPEKRIMASILYPATTGRNFNEILRVLHSLKLSATNRIATPADWQLGQGVMILPNVTDDEAQALFPQGFQVVPVPSRRSYIRVVRLQRSHSIP